MRSLYALIVVAIVLMTAAGCEKRREAAKTLVADDTRYIMTILLDFSGSFEHMMADGGKAYEFALAVLDKYFRDRIGSDDKLIIAQISGNDRALLWQGTPVQLRQEFSSPQAFAEFLRAKANPGGSLVHEAIARTIEYVNSEPTIANGKWQAALFVLSDMNSNGDKSDSKERALAALTEFGKEHGGVVGMYYVDQTLVAPWRQDLRTAGIKEFCVESEIVGKPNLPNLE